VLGRRAGGQAGRQTDRQARVVATRWPVACRAVSGGLLYLSKYIHTVVYCAGGCVSSRHHHQQADPVEYVHTYIHMYLDTYSTPCSQGRL
jgi:hypothetical protein